MNKVDSDGVDAKLFQNTKKVVDFRYTLARVAMEYLE
jgi:hypothetical protein